MQTTLITWGKPKLEIKKIGTTAWIELDTPVEKSTQLKTEKGEKKEAKEEGGGVVETKYNKSKYSLVFKLFVKGDAEKPIEDDDGVILDNYSIRLTPENNTLPGFIMDKSSVSVVETWTSEEGTMLEYTFDGLVPDAGKILKRYIAG